MTKGLTNNALGNPQNSAKKPLNFLLWTVPTNTSLVVREGWSTCSLVLRATLCKESVSVVMPKYRFLYGPILAPLDFCYFPYYNILIFVILGRIKFENCTSPKHNWRTKSKLHNFLKVGCPFTWISTQFFVFCANQITIFTLFKSTGMRKYKLDDQQKHWISLEVYDHGFHNPSSSCLKRA